MIDASFLTAEQRQHAWRMAFLHSLDLHADVEINWEGRRWRALGAAAIAALCDELLSERRTDDFSIPGDVTAADLDVLWRWVPRDEALSLVRSGGVCLLAACRLLYWLRSSPEDLAA